ncbi:MAG: hypothetical protein WBJ83_08450 [Thermacetogeniaceae bacterium]|nr:hypothetical protein [Syntrophomonadaceae bacterium]
MSNQEIIELLKQLGLSGDNPSEIERKMEEGGIAGSDSCHAGEVLDSIGSVNNLKGEEVADLVRELTSSISGEKRQELKEYISQAAQQLEDEELSLGLLKVMELFLKQD